MRWFKHDADASIDAKLQSMLLDYGAAGYGLYWYCIELIAQGVCENNITFELEHDARIIARNLNLSIQETKDMMKKMVELELFSITSNEKLACYALAKRLDQSMTSNTKMRSLISSIKEQNHDKVMTQSIVSHDKVMQEEKRREETRIDKNTLVLSQAQELMMLWNEFAPKHNLKSVLKLTDKRQKKIQSRFKDTHTFKEVFIAMLNKIENSSFLLGTNSTWKVDFDFLIDSEQNYVKIIEGKYDDKAREW